MSHPPDIRQHVTLDGPGVRVQIGGVGAVTIPDVGMAKLLLAYPAAWSSLDHVDPQRLADASSGRITARTAISIKQLLAAAVIREFVEPRDGETVAAEELPGPIFDDAQEMVEEVTGSKDAAELATMLAALFDRPLERTRRVVDAYLQRDAR